MRSCRVCTCDLTAENEVKNSGPICKTCKQAQVQEFKLANPKKPLLYDAKSRARRKGVPFDLTDNDFEIPEVCPVFGIPIYKGEGKASDNSPTLDRIIPELGYVPGNVECISMRANRLKNNATADEIRMLYDYYC
jgi:hypothetical protein